METIRLKDKYHLSSYDKELSDTRKLIDSIKSSGWVKPDMTIVNCFPEYSSRVTQVVNHRLSYLNRNELFEQMDLAMPYPNMVQVWNWCDKKYQTFPNYMSDWVRQNISTDGSYLFVTSRENLAVIRPFLKVKLEPDNYRLAALYVREGDLEPDFWVEKTDKRIIFEWENMDNPNWRTGK